MFCCLWTKCECWDNKHEWCSQIIKFLKKNKVSSLISFIGSHVQSLPIQTIKDEKSIDFVFTNEGVYSLRRFYL